MEAHSGSDAVATVNKRRQPAGDEQIGPSDTDRQADDQDLNGIVAFPNFEFVDAESGNWKIYVFPHSLANPFFLITGVQVGQSSAERTTVTRTLVRQRLQA